MGSLRSPQESGGFPKTCKFSVCLELAFLPSFLLPRAARRRVTNPVLATPRAREREGQQPEATQANPHRIRVPARGSQKRHRHPDAFAHPHEVQAAAPTLVLNPIIVLPSIT